MPRKSKLEKKPKPETSRVRYSSLSRKKPPVFPTWERLGVDLDRFAVPGGWIYRSEVWPSEEDRAAVAICFVPFSTYEHGEGE